MLSCGCHVVSYGAMRLLMAAPTCFHLNHLLWLLPITCHICIDDITHDATAYSVWYVINMMMWCCNDVMMHVCYDWLTDLAASKPLMTKAWCYIHTPSEERRSMWLVTSTATRMRRLPTFIAAWVSTEYSRSSLIEFARPFMVWLQTRRRFVLLVVVEWEARYGQHGKLLIDEKVDLYVWKYIYIVYCMELRCDQAIRWNISAMHDITLTVTVQVKWFLLNCCMLCVYAFMCVSMLCLWMSIREIIIPV